MSMADPAKLIAAPLIHFHQQKSYRLNVKMHKTTVVVKI